MIEDDFLATRNTHIPRSCINCGGGDIEYKGVGEYKCKNCGTLMYDDFGKVRNYLEEHRGATQSEVSRETGVSMDVIRHLLREDRIEIAANSGVYLQCEICKAPIRSGKYCNECARKVEHMQKEETAKMHKENMNMHGYGKATTGESGARRFIR
jgi:hypothetical protein